ncbi:hypothetical protein [Streptomyces hygroscopicus]|uniref:hypothetical protein n=1 Tax=Streptomyces hygroscopicus TaxID=1912 RepID=UPI0004C972EC|nr:hypothetical protein [Streptomyces hygroscopicus]
MADLRRLEHLRFLADSNTSASWPEAIDEAFWRWRAPARGPLRCVTGPLSTPRCATYERNRGPGFFRDRLETALHALPKKSARGLRVVVWPLDAKIVARTGIIRVETPYSWWWRMPFVT